VVGISLRTLQRWRKGSLQDQRQGVRKRVVRKLSAQEKERVIEAANAPDYRDLTPHEIVPRLLEIGIYLASVRTFYRVLKEHDQLRHRGNCRVRRKCRKPPERKATAINQVYCWDITWLARTVKGLFFFAYIVIDLYDRSIVGWSVHETEDERHSRDLFERITEGRNIRFKYLHSDNGHPMKGVTLMGLMEKLGIKASFSRPRQSNDNPFIESLFRTLKYRPGYPVRFETLEAAREWMMNFVHWYNTQHLHSSLDYVTPEQMRSGMAKAIFEKRNMTLETFKQQNPERWGSRKTKRWGELEPVILNPEKINQTRQIC
jgi:transposase InsO family protein